ncbi:MAG: small multi-drug export protein [Lachnospiraceae bacterium]|nr:small multi-drug export protein [Lachnospiraceae bacterium]
MSNFVTWFTMHMSGIVSKELIVFLISLMPILELRGGLLAASLLKVKLGKAILLCVIGNFLPIPFILLFIRKIFAWMRRFKAFEKMVSWFEAKAMSKSGQIQNLEFWGLVLFVGIPIPGTGAWMGSLIAALLNIDFKKALLAEIIGIAMATVLMSILSYGLLGSIL